MAASNIWNACTHEHLRGVTKFKGSQVQRPYMWGRGFKLRHIEVLGQKMSGDSVVGGSVAVAIGLIFTLCLLGATIGAFSWLILLPWATLAALATRYYLNAKRKPFVSSEVSRGSLSRAEAQLAELYELRKALHADEEVNQAFVAALTLYEAAVEALAEATKESQRAGRAVDTTEIINALGKIESLLVELKKIRTSSELKFSDTSSDSEREEERQKRAYRKALGNLRESSENLKKAQNELSEKEKMIALGKAELRSLLEDRGLVLETQNHGGAR